MANDSHNKGRKVGRHGHASGGVKSPTYSAWVSIMRRCFNERNPVYPRYGGRGITVCERWKNFELFLLDMGERPSRHHSPDRWPDNDGNYEPGNCRWATMKEQSRNRSSSRPVKRSDGVVFPTIAEAAETIGGSQVCIWHACRGLQKTHKGWEWEYA